MLRRIYDVDALACSCGGRLELVAVVTKRRTAEAILESIDLPHDQLTLSIARGPPIYADGAADSAPSAWA